MNNPLSKTLPSSRVSYLFIAIFALAQGIIVGLYADSDIYALLDSEGRFFYLPLIFAMFLPTAFSYLIISPKSKHLYYSIGIVVLLILWIFFWKTFNTAPESDLNDPATMILTLSILLFFLMPWLQYYTQHGTFRVQYAVLIKLYIRNILFGVIASWISGLLLLLIFLAEFLFDIIGFSALQDAMQASLPRWIIGLLGMNIALFFLRMNFEIEINRICGYIARVFLPLLNLITLIFLIGLLFSTGIEIDSGIMLSLSAASIVLINLVYEDGSSEYQFPKWLNLFILLNILLLNAFSFLTLYGISTRVLQYSWSMGRLYGFTLSLFFALLILAYSIAIIRHRTRWMRDIGKINSVFLLLIAGIVLAINSPLLNFQKISANSILKGVEKGEIPIDGTLRYTLQDLGKEGYHALDKIKNDPRFEAARAAENRDNPLQDSDTDNDSKKMPPPEETYHQIAGFPPIPQSWWSTQQQNYYCTDAINEHQCLAFTADMNQDGENEVLNCYIRNGDSTWIRCRTWQHQEATWEDIESQSFYFDSEDERDQSWKKLLNGAFEIRPKTWFDLYIPTVTQSTQPTESTESSESIQ